MRLFKVGGRQAKHTYPQIAVGYDLWTGDVTCIGLKYWYGRLIFCENENNFVSGFGDSTQHA